MKLEKRWVSAFVIITIVAITGLFWQHQTPSSQFNEANTINFADVAWLLTASCLVLLMTPGLSFFYGGMVGKKCYFHHAQKFYLSWCSQFTLGNRGF